MIQTPEEHWKELTGLTWEGGLYFSKVYAAIAARDAVIRAAAAEEKRLEVVAELRQLAIGRNAIAQVITDITGIASLQPPNPPRDPKALEVAEAIGRNCFLTSPWPTEVIADLLQSRVEKWRVE